MMDEDSCSTDLSVSGEEGHSTILLAHYIFCFKLRAKFFWQHWLRRKITQKCLEILLLLYNLNILASGFKKFLFF